MIATLSKTIVPFLVMMVGVLTYSKMNLSQRLIFWQVFSYVTILALTKQVMAYQKEVGLVRTTAACYNIYLPVEAIFVIMSTHYLFHHKLLQISSLVLLTLFLVFYSVELCFRGFNMYCVYSDLFENILVIVLYSILLFLEFHSNDQVWLNSPTFWISLGFILYSACTLPYMSLTTYFQKLNGDENRFVFLLLHGLFANIRYLFIGVAFLIIYRRQIK